MSQGYIARTPDNRPSRAVDRGSWAKRQKTPNEIALDILLAAMTIIFLLATATLLPFSLYSVGAAG